MLCPDGWCQPRLSLSFWCGTRRCNGQRRRKEGKEQVAHENIPPRSVIRIAGGNDRTSLETVSEPTLQRVLAAFDPKKHGDEAMDGSSASVEAFAYDNA
jgi:hypothetical protein